MTKKTERSGVTNLSQNVKIFLCQEANQQPLSPNTHTRKHGNKNNQMGVMLPLNETNSV